MEIMYKQMPTLTYSHLALIRRRSHEKVDDFDWAIFGRMGACLANYFGRWWWGGRPCCRLTCIWSNVRAPFKARSIRVSMSSIPANESKKITPCGKLKKMTMPWMMNDE